MTAGAVVCGGANLAWQLYKISNSPQPPQGFWETVSRINFFELGIFAAGGAVIAAWPDILEPAKNNPNHRDFFHSVVFGGAVLYGAVGKHSQKWHPDARFAAASIALSYLSHLYLDSGTTKGLPLT
jgi:membrane-bound metal-dependent hydrolase YbcI (DUF457 family)